MNAPEHAAPAPVPPVITPVAEPVVAETESVAAAPVTLERRDWLRMTQGLYFIFFGLLGTLATLMEVLISPTTRASVTLVSGAAAAAILTGSWRLFQIRHFTPQWNRRTRDMFIGGIGIAYLWLFFQMWLRLSSNLYLLGHALAYGALCFYAPTLVSTVIVALARGLSMKPLQTQAILFGAAAFVMMFLPYMLLANALVVAAQRGIDPLYAVQNILHVVPLMFLLTLLLPASLVLSLVWAAKDIAVRNLTGDAS